MTDHWSLVYDGFEPASERLREALCTLGNGYLAVRGAAPEAAADSTHYPGTYVAGCYNRLDSHLEGRTVTHEDLVNLPNWLPLTFRIEDGDWFDVRALELLDYRQELDMRRGVLTRQVRCRDPAGRTTAVTQRRLVSMDEPHLAALETTIVPEDWTGTIEVLAALDGRVTNAGVERYRSLASDHVRPLQTGDNGVDSMWLKVETVTSEIRIAEAARVRVAGADEIAPRTFEHGDGEVTQLLRLSVSSGTACTIHKIVTVFTSLDRATTECLSTAREQLTGHGDFEHLFTKHLQAWRRTWSRCRIAVPGDAQRLLNVHMFHLIQTLSEHTADLDVGVPARGLHGEAYRGHIFWDELFVFPFYTLRFPEVARAVLMYRWRRLPAARRAARAAGLRGAMYPWQSGSDGSEETPAVHLNPRSGHWVPDNSQLQRHVGIAVAHNVWQYVQATGDLTFLERHGAEMLVEIARFWCSLAVHNPARDRYEIRGVMGPDEYHDAYPGADRPGLDNNAYTNVMAVRVIRHALDALTMLSQYQRRDLTERLGLAPGELARFEDVSTHMFVAFHGDGVISQFEGFERLDELDWDGYRAKYDDIRRLDRILEAEGDSPNYYQACKQADVLMLLFLLSREELIATLESLEYRIDEAALDRTIEYYLARTSHGSTLSAVVHAWVLARQDRHASWRFFLEALASDVADIQGGTTGEGIHLGAMAGTIDLLQRCYTGLRVHDDMLSLDPLLPPELGRLDLELTYRGNAGVAVTLTGEKATVGLDPSVSSSVTVSNDGDVRTLQPGQTWQLPR
jgi:trehalose/maltose hydrolase-like predicted phosphorylase